MGNIIKCYDAELNVLTTSIRLASVKYLKTTLKYEKKENELGVFDLVTDADLNAEKIMKEYISSKYPNDHFFCEESNNEAIGNGRTWVIDPIDGTLNFVKKIPLFGTQAALLENGEVVVSAIYLPSTDEMYTAIKGRGAFLNDCPIKISDTENLIDCVMSIGDYSKGSIPFRKNQSSLMDAAYNHIARIKMIGASSYDFALFSSGRTDIHVRFVRNPWDFMPGFLISTEAGGVYDEELYEKYRLFIIANRHHILSDFRKSVIDKMKFE